MLRCLLLFAHAFAIQANYTALANARGCIEERLARSLLMARDRLDSDQMLLTHAFLAVMLAWKNVPMGSTAHRRPEYERLFGTAEKGDACAASSTL